MIALLFVIGIVVFAWCAYLIANTETVLHDRRMAEMEREHQMRMKAAALKRAEQHATRDRADMEDVA